MEMVAAVPKLTEVADTEEALGMLFRVTVALYVMLS